MEPTGELHRRKLFAGIAMILAPLLVGIAYMVGPAMRRDTAERLTEMAAAPGRFDFAMIVGLSGLVLFVFTAFALVHLLREERPLLGDVGGVLAVTGLVLIGVIQGSYVVGAEAAQLDVAGAAVVAERVMDNPVMIVAFVGSIATAIGLLMLAYGLLQSRTAPTWSAGLLGIGSIVQWLGIAFASTPITVAGFVILFLALAPLGMGLITEPDEAWEHPPHFEGFRPVTSGL